MQKATAPGDVVTVQRVAHPADASQRLVAGIVDGLVILTFASLGYQVPFLRDSGFYWGIAAYLLIVGLPLMAWRGVSFGRLVTRIRLRRLSDGRPPGIIRAGARTGLVLLTGLLGLPWFLFVWYGEGQGGDASWNQQRLWWDWALDTVVVESTDWKVSVQLTPSELIQLQNRFHPKRTTHAKRRPEHKWYPLWWQNVLMILLGLVNLILTVLAVGGPLYLVFGRGLEPQIGYALIAVLLVVVALVAWATAGWLDEKFFLPPKDPNACPGCGFTLWQWQPQCPRCGIERKARITS